MNEEALLKTLEYGEAVYYSRSRKTIWHKGKTSGLIQTVKEIVSMMTVVFGFVLMLLEKRVVMLIQICFYRSIPFGKNFDPNQK